MPEELKELIKDLLRNFDEIHIFHTADFTENLRNSIFSAEKIRDLLRDKKNEMKSIYGRYCNNWKKSEYILKIYRSTQFTNSKA